DMVHVAGLGRGAAVWEHALRIPPVHLPAQAVGNLVAAHGYMLGEVEDRADGDASSAAPLLDLVHAHRCLGVLAPADLIACKQSCLAQVHHERHGPPAAVCARASAPSTARLPAPLGGLTMS